MILCGVPFRTVRTAYLSAAAASHHITKEKHKNGL